MVRLPPETPYSPFEPGPHRMQLGLVSQPPEDLIEIDARYSPDMAERRALFDTRRADVLGAVPGTASAHREVLDRLAILLPARFPDWFARDGQQLHNRLTDETWDLADLPHDPLEVAARLVQDDLCLIDVATGAPVLAAAALCAPSRWRLHEKLGRPLAEVHAPVPLYADTLSKPVDRFMRHLGHGKLTRRLNWSMTDDPALFQLTGKHRDGLDPSITPDTVPDRLHLRVERQTLSRLPLTGMVLFTIRVHSTPIAQAVPDPATAARLRDALLALPDAMATYKSLPVFRDALLAWLQRRAA